MNKLTELIKQAEYVYICGNGGSAATAEHFTNDLFSGEIRAICLNSNTSIITMIANDFGYEHIFSKQLELFGTRDDLLITISCSGTSPNVVNAQIVAKKKRMAIYNFETFKDDRDYETLEDNHLILCHLVKKEL